MLVRGGLPSGPETEQGLKRGHGLPAPIVAKDEFIKKFARNIPAFSITILSGSACGL
jgi:hypothetical protein